MRLFVIVAAACALAACATSPGRDCDTQEISQAGKANNAAQSKADTGVDVTGKQHMGDTVPTQPNTLVARGEGDQNTGITTKSNRSQAGAPVTYQGVVNVFPATAESEAGSGGPTPQQASLDRQIVEAEKRLSLALAKGQVDEAKAERDLIASLNDKMADATKNAKQDINMTFNMDGQISTQGVASSAGANSEPKSTEAGEQGASTKDVPATLKASGVIPATSETSSANPSTASQPAPEAPDSPPKTPAESGGGTD